MRPIYLDYNATTPVAGAVLEAMLPYLHEVFGNPSSQHALGAPAREAVVEARAQVARLIGASSDEIIFTSGGTEATNHALKGLAWVALRDARAARQIVVSAVEHPATLEVASALQRFGFTVVRIPVDGQGVLQLEALERALATPTLVVSLMHANNETGTLQPIESAARLAHRA
ncbi:MAG: aminotransferase class V-fold PLP-dependent enzyme, partial [Betaproteobacteria bacterium]